MEKELRQHNSRMQRGAKWWSFRDREDVLPKDIFGDDGKMCDVKYYLKFKDATDDEIKQFVPQTIGQANNTIFKLADAFSVAGKKVKK